MIQDLFIIGATGKVGKTLIDQIVRKEDTNSQVHRNPTRIVGLASSRNFIFSPHGISPEVSYSFANKQCSEMREYNTLDELLEAVNNSHRNEESTLVFVDVTSVNEPITQFHLRVIRSKPYGIVTANKNPIALSGYDTFQELTRNPRRYGYRCSVMAGAEAVTFLQDLSDLSDNLQLIEGCFSGTLGYITSELEKSRKFSDILREANKRGYTEPHPRDDLNGLDVARKLVVLARTAGYPISVSDVKVSPFIPPEYFLENNPESFLNAVARLDDKFSEKVARARSDGLTLRYVARMDIKDTNPTVEVSLKEVPKQSPLGVLEGTMNKIVIVSETYPNGYSVEAPGAGLDVTARNIRRDLLYLLDTRETRMR